VASFVSVRYVGPHDHVNIPSAGIDNLKRGETFSVTPELADSLLEQPDNYEAVKEAVK